MSNYYFRRTIRYRKITLGGEKMDIFVTILLSILIIFTIIFAGTAIWLIIKVAKHIFKD